MLALICRSRSTRRTLFPMSDEASAKEVASVSGRLEPAPKPKPVRAASKRSSARSGAKSQSARKAPKVRVISGSKY